MAKLMQKKRKYYAIDVLGKYHLNKIFTKLRWFDPYPQLGAGYSSIGGEGRVTANIGLGSNFWLTERWALNINTIGKWGIGPNKTKQLQHTAGIVYRFTKHKELIEDLDKEEELIEEEQEVIKIVPEEESEEERARAKAIAEHNRKMDSLQRRRKKIEDYIENLGVIAFNFNSSYLTEDAKQVLNDLAEFLKEHPSVVLEISSYADARGTQKYNLWLSERRVKRTADYLISKDVSAESLILKAMGETHPLNNCVDGIKCTEEEHKINRRSEFRIIEMD